MSIQNKLKFLKLIIHSEDHPTGLTGVCGGYELKKWRYEQFSNWLFDDHLLDFALTHSDLEKINYQTAVAHMRKAARTIFQTSNLHRGEFGELILHALIKEAFDTIPAISKIYFKDGPNETVKGFDAVHVVATKDEIQLWLGEVKFYSNFNQAVRDVLPELEAHFEREYLRNEFAAITNKIDKSFTHYDKLVKLLDPNTSLDEVFGCICVPILLTYDSSSVLKHREFNEEYVEEILAEVQVNFQYFLGKLTSPLRIHLFVLPLENKANLSEKLIEKLRTWQKI